MNNIFKLSSVRCQKTKSLTERINHLNMLCCANNWNIKVIYLTNKLLSTFIYKTWCCKYYEKYIKYKNRIEMRIVYFTILLAPTNPPRVLITISFCSRPEKSNYLWSHLYKCAWKYLSQKGIGKFPFQRFVQQPYRIKSQSKILCNSPLMDCSDTSEINKGKVRTKILKSRTLSQ